MTNVGLGSRFELSMLGKYNFLDQTISTVRLSLVVFNLTAQFNDGKVFDTSYPLIKGIQVRFQVSGPVGRQKF